MPPDAAPATATPQQSNSADTGTMAALEGAFDKAITGGAMKKDPSTGRFVSPRPKAQAAAAEAAPAVIDFTPSSTAAPAQGDGAARQAQEPAPSGEVEQQTQAEPSAETPIEPPASWSKERHDLFRSLPREAQDYLAQRERERDVEVRRGQNESADHRKAAEAERVALNQERQQLAQTASLYVSDLERKFLADYGHLQSLDELDEVQYVQMQRALQGIQLHRQQQAQLQQQVGAAAEHELEAYRATEDRAYREENGLTDPAKWKTASAELSAFAREAGVQDQEMAGASRVHLGIVRDAMLYRRSQKALADARAKDGTAAAPPKVQAPGTARGGGGKDERSAALMQQLRKDGSTAAAETLFAHALLKGASRDSNKRNVR